MVKTQLLPTTLITLFFVAACGGEEEFAVDTTLRGGTTGCADCRDVNATCQLNGSLLEISDLSVPAEDLTSATYSSFDFSEECPLSMGDLVVKQVGNSVVLDLTVPSSCTVGADGLLTFGTASGPVEVLCGTEP